MNQCDTLWKRHDHDPFELSYDTAGDLIYPWDKTVKAYYWPCQLKANHFSTKKRHLLGQWLHIKYQEMLYHIYYGSCNWNHYLIKFSIVNCHSSWSICVLQWPGRIIKGRCAGNHHPCVFKSMMVELISAVSPGMWYYLKRQLQWLPFGLSNQ